LVLVFLKQMQIASISVLYRLSNHWP